jgi:hypothetical protein
MPSSRVPGHERHGQTSGHRRAPLCERRVASGERSAALPHPAASTPWGTRRRQRAAGPVDAATAAAGLILPAPVVAASTVVGVRRQIHAHAIAGRAPPVVTGGPMADIVLTDLVRASAGRRPTGDIPCEDTAWRARAGGQATLLADPRGPAALIAARHVEAARRGHARALLAPLITAAAVAADAAIEWIRAQVVAVVPAEHLTGRAQRLAASPPDLLPPILLVHVRQGRPATAGESVEKAHPQSQETPVHPPHLLSPGCPAEDARPGDESSAIRPRRNPHHDSAGTRQRGVSAQAS